MIARTMQAKLQQLATKYPFVTITGPRQSGKSTLAELTFPDYKRVSLEDLDNREFATEDPRGFIATYPSHTIIDEVQRVPSLLSYLQTHTDQERQTGMYILTGSQNTELMEAVDQSLAGRVGILTLLPFSHEEMRHAGILPRMINGEIFNGAYPSIYDRDIEPTDYYPNYIKTYIERDVRQMKAIGDLSKFRRLIKLCAGRIGQLLNKASLAVECGVSAPTVDAWLSILEESYIIHFLRPDYNNFSKRLIKSPKLYFYDTGLACSLLEIRDVVQLDTHYLRGGLFENLVVNEFLKRNYNRGVEPSLSFWHDSSGNEVDLIRTERGVQYAYEIKSGATCSKEYFKGLDYWAKLSGTGADRKTVIYGGEKSMSTSGGSVMAWNDM
ncbi:ATP-binding protein [Alistipes indistinctus]|uniref:ATP-binding protein n=1 Tax=Alistipes indistinctus TaxID=626932 RepID=UPI0032BFFA48